MIPIPILAATGLSLLLLPFAASAATLSLPADASVAVHVIDELTLDADTPRQDDILLSPVSGDTSTSHELPQYCVLVGNARLDAERIRITTKSLTCIETEGAESEIFSGEISAAAYEMDGSYGIDACDAGRCELTPGHAFQLRLASTLDIEQQDNPAARINEQRRQEDGAGIANPIPAEHPDPDQ